jgi:hypothetical protein
MEFRIITHGIDDIINELDAMHKNQVPFATSKALNKTAQAVKANLVSEMANVFDRPTPYTLRSLYVKPSTKKNLQAVVWLKDSYDQGIPATKYLWPEIFGGGRDLKRFEEALRRTGVLPNGMIIVPPRFGAPETLDAYGNIKRSLIVQMLSYFSAFGQQGYKANINEKRKARLAKGTKKTQGFEYFVSGGKRTITSTGKPQHLPPGIYRRSTGYWSAWGSPIKPIFMFVKKPLYPKRLPFFETGKKTINTMFRPLFISSLEEAIKTAK